MSAIQCHCRLCELDREIAKIKASEDVGKMFPMIDRLHGLYAEADEDLAYHRAILNGTWPGAREILERALAKCPPEVEG